MSASTALSVSVTRSDAVVGGFVRYVWEREGFGCLGKQKEKDLQFFLVSVDPIEGRAEVISWPACFARVMRKSWISWRSGAAWVVGAAMIVEVFGLILVDI